VILRADKLTRGWAAAAIYSVIAIIWTWPLARHLNIRIASDLGDPLFNSWVLAWTSGQVLSALRGDVGALSQYWHGNIFHPEPLTLAYSEHLTAQMIQGLPIYTLTGNILTTYNLLFIATFAISGLGMYLFARAITGRPLAAFLAGLAFAYAPYRLGQFSHLQVLSTYWMPLALYGFRRYFDTRRPRALAGGAAALVMQNLSCGYFMLFFTPFAAAYVAYEIVARRMVGNRTALMQVAIAGATVMLLTWPFVAPYLQLRDVQDLGVRAAGEIQMFSADTYAFASIAPNSRLLAEARAGYWAPEGEGFVGFTILTFAAIGIVAGLTRVVREIPWRLLPLWQRGAIALALVLCAGSAAVVGWFFVNGGVELSWNNSRVVYRNVTGPLQVALWSLVGVLVLRALAHRAQEQRAPRVFGFIAISAATAALLALGPRIRSLGNGLGEGPYAWLLAYVPGFDGLRVPARFLMVSALFMAVLVGLGAAALLASRLRRAATPLVFAGAIGILAESWVAPLQMNMPVIPAEDLDAPPAPAAGRRVSPVYRSIRDLPGQVRLVEFPFGESAYDLLATFYAGYHRRPLLNGYSGFFPRSFAVRAEVWRQPLKHREAAAATLHASEVTHVLVHEDAFRNGVGREISDWLISLGARQVAANQSDRLFQLR
jgi:hypothetical protein